MKHFGWKENEVRF